MTIIEAASGSVKTMADGTLRISVDVEPRHAQAAFALFGSPGTAMALAALKTAQERAEAPAPADPAPNVEERKGGPLAILAGKWCADEMFQRWLAAEFPNKWEHFFNQSARSVAPKIDTSLVAARVVRMVCCIESRAELDHDEAAADIFHKRIRGPYQKHCLARGKTVENAGA